VEEAHPEKISRMKERPNYSISQKNGASNFKYGIQLG